MQYLEDYIFNAVTESRSERVRRIRRRGAMENNWAGTWLNFFAYLIPSRVRGDLTTK